MKDKNKIIEIFSNWKYIPSTKCMIDVCKSLNIESTQYELEMAKKHLKEKGVPLYKIETRVIKKGRDIIIPLRKL